MRLLVQSLPIQTYAEFHLKCQTCVMFKLTIFVTSGSNLDLRYLDVAEKMRRNLVPCSIDLTVDLRISLGCSLKCFGSEVTALSFVVSVQLSDE